MPAKMMKQIVEFNKAAFENSFSMLETIQGQMERMMSIYMDKASGLPEEASMAIYEWMGIYKKGCEDFKKSMDDGFRKLDVFFSQKKS